MHFKWFVDMANEEASLQGIQSYTKCRFFNLMKEFALTNLFVD